MGGMNWLTDSGLIMKQGFSAWATSDALSSSARTGIGRVFFLHLPLDDARDADGGCARAADLDATVERFRQLDHGLIENAAEWGRGWRSKVRQLPVVPGDDELRSHVAQVAETTPVPGSRCARSRRQMHRATPQPGTTAARTSR